MQVIRVLIGSAGRRVELLEAIRADCHSLNLECRITALDCNPQWSSACAIADKAIQIVPVSDPMYLDQLRNIILTERINIAIPTIDPELDFFAMLRDSGACPSCTIISHSREFIAICRDKERTSLFLSERGVRVPKLYTRDDFLSEKIAWPVIAKPRSGSGSVGIHIFSEYSPTIQNFINSSYVIQEYIEGAEYTVNAYVDRKGVLLGVVAHVRQSIRAGEVEKAQTVDIPAARLAAKVIANFGGFLSGPFCFQGKLTDDGLFSIFEINARFGGGYPLARKAGANFSLWIIQEFLGQVIEEAPIEIGLRMLRYDRSIFIASSKELR
jgi:carbamoyl-phosphate synthase large subunit